MKVNPEISDIVRNMRESQEYHPDSITYFVRHRRMSESLINHLPKVYYTGLGLGAGLHSLYDTSFDVFMLGSAALAMVLYLPLRSLEKRQNKAEEVLRSYTPLTPKESLPSSTLL